jgi:hypothetical protein
VLLTANGATQTPTSLETMKAWFESEAAAIMRSSETSRLGTIDSSVRSVRLQGCTLSWTTENDLLVRIPLGDIDVDSLRVRSSVLLDSLTVFSITMATRAEVGQTIIAEGGGIIRSMTSLARQTGSKSDGRSASHRLDSPGCHALSRLDALSR